jgi:hypothetical protein
VFDTIAVCLPTVRQRADVLAETLAQWTRLGVTPLVAMQPEDWPLNRSSQRRTAERPLRQALDERPDASHLLFCEDDIDLAPELPSWLPAIVWSGAPVTLFLPLLRHYPADIRKQVQRGQLLTEGLAPVQNLQDWWGTQAVVLPRALVEAVLCWESGRVGWDAQLQDYLVAHGVTLYVTVPNLVQQRGVPPIVAESTADGAHRSQTFGLPSARDASSPGRP